MRLNAMMAFGLFAFVAVVGGCASVTKQTTNVYPEPKPEKGLVYFYREKRFAGCVVSYNIKENDQIVGAIANGTYFFVFADPGKHTYTAATETSTTCTIDIEAGKTYYIEASVGWGVFAGHPVLKTANEAESLSVIRELTYATK